MSKDRLFLIDATAFCYRAFYALKGLSTTFGQPTNAIYGFLNMLNKVLKDNKPAFIGVCFDVSRQTFRQEKFAEYKSNRPPMPDGLSSQIPLIKEIVAAYGLPIFEKEGFEADDVIAALSRKAKVEKLPVVVVSSDKDMLQLVDDNTEVMSLYQDKVTVYDETKVFERFGVKPGQISDIIALMGDVVDNIPGVPGIGEKTAAELIKNFGSVEKLLSRVGEVKQERVRASLKEHAERIKLNKELAFLNNEVGLDAALEELKPAKPDYDKLFKLFRRLEFKKMLKGLPVEQAAVEEPGPLKLDNQELKKIAAESGEIILYLQDSALLAVCAAGKFFALNDFSGSAGEFLADAKAKKIGHDLKYLKVLMAGRGVRVEGLAFDLMLAAHLIDPAKGDYSLAGLAADFLEKRPGIIGNEEALKLIAELRPRLEKELEDKSLSKLFAEIEMPMANVLAEMEITGIKLDLNLLQSLSRDIEKRLIKLIENIYAISGTQFNINSPKQLREILFERLKLPVIKKSKTGPSTDEEVLRALAPKHELPAQLLEYRQLTKLKSTYIDALPELVDPETGRVHTSFNQAATETGRLSSSNPNLQNIPLKSDIGKQIRRAVIASAPGRLLLSCDYSQVELRILAHLSQDENLIAAFKADKDIHKATAALIYGSDEFTVSNEMRETAKRINFGIIYGLSSYGLSRDLGIQVNEAQNFIDAYFLKYAGVKKYIDEQIKRAERDGFVTTILGRRRYIPFINNKNQSIRQLAQRQAVNTPIQGSAADLIKLAMIEIYPLLKEKLPAAKMIMQIHDELVFDLPEINVVELSALARDRMENALRLEVPVRVSLKKGKNWLEMEAV